MTDDSFCALGWVDSEASAYAGRCTHPIVTTLPTPPSGRGDPPGFGRPLHRLRPPPLRRRSGAVHRTGRRVAGGCIAWLVGRQAGRGCCGKWWGGGALCRFVWSMGGVG